MPIKCSILSVAANCDSLGIHKIFIFLLQTKYNFHSIKSSRGLYKKKKKSSTLKDLPPTNHEWLVIGEYGSTSNEFKLLLITKCNNISRRINTMRQTVSSFSSLLSLSYTYKTIVLFSYTENIMCVCVAGSQKGRYPWTMCTCIRVATDWSVVIYKNHSIICPVTHTHTHKQSCCIYLCVYVAFPNSFPLHNTIVCVYFEREKMRVELVRAYICISYV